MKLLITGVSHKTAPVEVREGLAFGEETAPQALADLSARDGVEEALIAKCTGPIVVASTPLSEAAAEAWIPRTCFKNGPPSQLGVELELLVVNADQADRDAQRRVVVAHQERLARRGAGGQPAGGRISPLVHARGNGSIARPAGEQSAVPGVAGPGGNRD